MANRCTPTNQIEGLSGGISAATYFDANWNNPVNALNDASLGYTNAIATDSGSANNYIVTCPFGTPTGYNPGMYVCWIAANTNTGASTLTVSPLVSASLLDANGNALTAGIIQAGAKQEAIYISGAFRLSRTGANGPGVFHLVNSASGTTTLTQNVGGYSMVTIDVNTFSGPGASTTVLLLQNVVLGAQINVYWRTGGTGQTIAFSNACTDANGFTIPNVTQFLGGGGGVIDLIGTGQTGVSIAMIFTGAYFYMPSLTSNSGIRFGTQAYH